MTNEAALLSTLGGILRAEGTRPQKLKRVAAAIRDAGSYRWVGLYEVDHSEKIVRNLVWSGPSAPAFLSFPIGNGLTSSAIQERRSVNVGDVLRDSRYLTALGSTESEIIVPIFNASTEEVRGTIDIESDQRDAFSVEAQSVLEKCAELIQPLWA